MQIIAVVGSVAIVLLSLMLIIAILMSQFSAAIADTGDAGGLLNKNSNKRISTKVSYIGISICAILLMWSVNLMEVIALASRAFATHYLLQTLLALIHCYKDCPANSPMTFVNRGLYIMILIILDTLLFLQSQLNSRVQLRNPEEANEFHANH